MRTIVFGASGFIGSHVTEQLRLAGYEVSAIVRPTSNTAFLNTLGVKIIPLERWDESALRQVMNGQEIVYNCTAQPRMHEREAVLRRVEVDLTARLAKAAGAAGVNRFIQLSTIVVYGFDSAPPINEETPCHPRYTFPRVMLERESILSRTAAENGLDYLILRPAGTTGARDGSLFPRLAKAIRGGKFPVIGDGKARFSFIDTRDIGRAMVHLATLPSFPRLYLVKGFDIMWLDLKQELESVLGMQSKLLSLSPGLGRILGLIMEKLAPYGKEPMLTRFAVDMMTHERVWDDQRIRDMDFRPSYNLHDAVEDAARSFGLA